VTLSRKKPGVAFWATVVVVVLLVAYPLSFGPACWMYGRGVVTLRAITTLYSPMFRFMRSGPRVGRELLRDYVRVGCPRAELTLANLEVAAAIHDEVTNDEHSEDDIP
jgi:hypothetical protein